MGPFYSPHLSPWHESDCRLLASAILVAHHVERCPGVCLSLFDCALSKTSTKPTSGLLHPLPIPSHPWSHIALDFVTGLPASNRNSVILTIIDRFSKMAHFIPLSKLTSSRDLLVYIMCIVCMASPLTSSSDRGLQFTSQVVRSFCSALGINVSLSSGYHP